MYDRATSWLACYPAATKSAVHCLEAFKDFEGPQKKVKSFYCDNAPELKKACRHLGWGRPSATTGIHETNGLAERMVRKVKDGGRCLLIQSGLAPHDWWEFLLPLFAHIHNISCLLYTSPSPRDRG